MCKMMAFMGVMLGLGLLCYMLLGITRAFAGDNVAVSVARSRWPRQLGSRRGREVCCT